MPLHNAHYREFLSQELARRLEANPRYSQRAFARDLSLSPGELSEIIKGTRKLTHKTAHKISLKLGLNATERQRLYELVDKGNLDANHQEGLSTSRLIELDRFELMVDPIAVALICLTELQDFKWNEAWIAKRLAVSELEVRVAIDRLVRAGFLKRGTKVRYEVVDTDYIVSTQDIPSQAIRNYHRKILRLAEQSLELQPVKEREISGVTLAVRSKDLSGLKKEISAFLDHIAQRYGKVSKNKDAVYHLETAFFKIDKGDHS